MKEKIKNIIDKGKEMLGKLSPKVRKLLIAGIGLAIIFSVVAAVILHNKPYDMLFTDLNDQEASEIIGKLQESQIDYKYETGGTILVPKEQVDQLKAQLVYEGYPKSGFSYNVFKDNIGLTTTDFEKNNYALFDLQERLKATIELFPSVKEAAVTIAPGEDRKYVLDSSNVTEATASVVIVMKDGETPSEDLVKGIQRLVSTSIPQVTFDKVSVVDGNGVDVTSIGDDSQEGANKVKIQFEQAMEDSIKAKVLNLLGPIYGADHVRVSVRCDADVDRKMRELINYTPTTDDNLGIPQTVMNENEMIRGGDDAGGVPGAETNADITTYANMDPDGTETYLRNQQNVDYLVSQLKEQAQVDSALLRDVTISVAVDGTDLGSVSKEELTDLIARAAGITPDVQNDKIAIISAPFYQPPSIIPPIIDDEGMISTTTLIIIGIAGVVLLFVILIIVLIVLRRRKKKKQLEAEAAAAEVPEAVPVEVPETEKKNLSMELLNLQNEHGLELKEKIREFTEENPEISAQLLKQWLRGGEEGGQ